MAKRSGILTGTAGVYYVAYQLADRGFHAAVTYGNAPSVDILVGILDGSATLSLQVKASSWAVRTHGRGEKKSPHHYEWDVGENSAKLNRMDLFFAFVDLKSQSGLLPDVFIIPSKEIFEYFRNPYFQSKPNVRWRYHPEIQWIEQYKNNWDTLRNYLNGKAQPGATSAPVDDT